MITDLDDHLETFAGQVDLSGFVLDKEDQATLFVDINRDRLDAFFAIRPGIVIPPGEYDFADLRLHLRDHPDRQNFYASGTVHPGPVLRRRPPLEPAHLRAAPQPLLPRRDAVEPRRRRSAGAARSPPTSGASA